MIHRTLSLGRRQRGAVLVVSLLLLLVMTVLALGASQATRMQERMAGNARDRDMALQSVEAGLRAGERFIGNPSQAYPIPCTLVRTVGCEVYELGKTFGVTDTYENQAFQTSSWWKTNTWDYAATNTMSGPGLVVSDPHYYVEELEEVRDSLSIPPTGPVTSRTYYRITARGAGGSDAAEVMLQSTYSRRF